MPTDTISLIMEGPDGLAKFIPEYEVRNSQVEGVRAVQASLANNRHFIFEGPCGYGKSVTYLVPAMLQAIQGQKIVVATAGITLQEQIFYKDIPKVAMAVTAITGQPVTYAYMKGRNNFACRRKVAELAFDISTRQPNIDLKEEKVKLISWADSSNRGDVSELSYVPKHEVWKTVACIDRSDCQGSACDYFQTCFYQRMKQNAKNCNLVVCNYHVLFADWETGGRLLDGYDALICDEAHEVAKIARDFMEVKFSYFHIVDIQRKITHATRKFPQLIRMDGQLMQRVTAEAQQWFTGIVRDFPIGKFNSQRPLPRGTEIQHTQLRESLAKLANQLEKAALEISEDLESASVDEQAAAKLLSSAAGLCLKSIESLATLCHQTNPQMGYWLEKGVGDYYSLHGKPIKVDRFLGDNFFALRKDSDRALIPTVLTSATLSVDGGFQYLKSELGITAADEMIADSPFNLTQQQLWYLPQTALEGNSKEFSARMIDNLVETVRVCRGGALCLFTSTYNMSLAADAVRSRLPHLKVYKQGDLPRQSLLEKFEEEVDSVLIATKSFFAGVDIKGESLRCLIIDKLPFESPEDPVMKALCEEDGGFFKYSIPNMIITLKQAIGRSIRSTTDKCVVAVLDNRLATARYKWAIANSFNYAKTVTRDISTVEAFINSYLQESKKI